MSTQHTQADILIAIAHGKTIQRFYPIMGGVWDDSVTPLSDVIENQKLRIKPTTININGHEVPHPVREQLENGDSYFVVTRLEPCGVRCLYWTSGPIDLQMLSLGLIHITQEAAIAHVEALLSFTRSDKSTTPA